MVDPKVLNLLEMAERGELPSTTKLFDEYQNLLILDGALTRYGGKLLQNHKIETADLSTIHSQLGELKYKVEKLDGIVSKNPQVYGSFCQKSCCCELTPEMKKQIAMEYCTENPDPLREKMAELTEKIIDLAKDIQGL